MSEEELANYDWYVTDDDCACSDGEGAWLDGCDICIEGTTGLESTCEYDCNNDPGGSAYIDLCGNCVLENNPNCIQDCSGAWGGDLELDVCNVCGGNDSTCWDCASVPNGDSYIDQCGNCILEKDIYICGPY